MKELPDYLCLVFAESEVDKRNRMYKAVKACGTIAEFARQDGENTDALGAGLLGKQERRSHREIWNFFSPRQEQTWEISEWS